MHGFAPKDLIDTGSGFVIHRRAHVIGVEVEGVVDDAVSEAWRAALAAEIKRSGHPRYLAIDFSRCDPQNSMATRYRTASFAREHMRIIEWGVLLTGRSPGPLVVVRAVLRTLGLPNLQMTPDSDYFESAVAHMLRGMPPPPPSSQSASARSSLVFRAGRRVSGRRHVGCVRLRRVRVARAQQSDGDETNPHVSSRLKQHHARGEHTAHANRAKWSYG